MFSGGHLVADLQSDSLQGRDLFEAQQYAKADDLYDQVLKQRLTADQRRVVMLNRAAVSIAKKDWNEAVDRLKEIDLDDDPHPLVFELRNTYLAYALMQWSRAQEPKDAIVALKAALQIFDAIEETDHRDSIEAWRSEAKNRLVDAQTRLIDQQIDSADAASLTAILARGLDILVHRLDSIGEAINDDIPRDTVAAWAGILRNQKRVWTALRERIEEGEDQQQIQWLRRAESQSKLASDLFEELRQVEGREETVLTASALDIIAAEDRVEALLTERAQTSFTVDILPPVLAQARKNSENKLAQWAWEELEQQLQARPPDEATLEEQQTLLWRQEQVKELLEVLEAGDSDTQDDLAFYLLLDEPEGEILGSTYTDLATLVDLDKGTAGQAEGFARLLRTVRRKLLLRQKAQKDVALKERASSASRPLDRARRRDTSRPPTEQLDNLSKAAAESLRFWDAERLLVAQLDRLINATQAALPTSDRQAINKLSQIYREVRVTISHAKLKSAESVMLDEVETLMRRSESRRNYALKQVSYRRFARMLLKDSMHWLEAARSMLAAKPLSASELLSKAIDEAERARDLNQEVLAILDTDQEIDVLRPIMLIEQEHVKIIAEPFLVTLANEQQTQPLEHAIRDQVVDLFEQGSLAATAALTLLMVAPPEQQEALVRQQETIDHWQEALELLKDDEGQDEQQQDDDGSSDGQDPDEQEHEEQVQHPSSRPDKVLDLIQQMEQEDRELQQQRKLPPTEGLRPW